jgi:hypothetical protein
MIKKLIAGGVAVAAVTAVTACSSTASTVSVPAVPSVSVTQSSGIGVHPATYVSQFREQFPSLAAGKSDHQILSDGEADCNDMAAAGELTTTAMARRYGLGDSTADKFTLSNVALLATFTLCGVR